MGWINWVFDGIGSQIVGIIVGLLLGGTGGIFTGYHIGIKNKTKQLQKAKNNATQEQIGNINIINNIGDIDRNGK